ncbi:VOC family protein [Nonomuraea sp. MCN248]|uniref:VOC family protein n=1 Tax=Nonomuraea corallina TaxID=2989783 RepID=A0ABT4S421_9ACTN|nr:VOC family protein [Nonomuraea corallina]MDA0631951.1 VOC family protein [Nonomuraea corallina]
MAVGIFAGIPVRDCKSAVEWYTRLLGAGPSFRPHEAEAVWRLAEDRYVYVVEDAARAGGGVCLIWVDDPEAEVDRIAVRGLRPVDREQHGDVGKWVFRDPDGNETGIGGELAP